MSERTLKNIAWLAGLLEGEAWFGLIANRPQIQLKMTDQDVVVRAGKLLHNHGNRIYCNQPKGANRKLVYSTTVCGKHAIAWMMTIYPLLGIRRKLKIKAIILEWFRLSNNGRGRSKSVGGR